jgi:hypothetical protein
MVKKKHGVIIETPMEARQAEPGPSVMLTSAGTLLLRWKLSDFCSSELSSDKS